MTREDILEAAAQVFRQKGFHGASMADIAGVVNLQKASLYHHVSSKQEILLALLDRALELLFERISAISTQSIPADDLGSIKEAELVHNLFSQGPGGDNRSSLDHHAHDSPLAQLTEQRREWDRTVAQRKTPDLRSAALDRSYLSQWRARAGDHDRFSRLAQ